MSFDKILGDASSRGRTQSCTTALRYSLDDDADHMVFLESRSARSQSSVSYQSPLGRRAGSFTPPMPRAISNTINKICSRAGSRRPTAKKKGIFSRHVSEPEPPTKQNTGTGSPLPSPQSYSRLGAVVTSARHAQRR